MAEKPDPLRQALSEALGMWRGRVQAIPFDRGSWAIERRAITQCADELASLLDASGTTARPFREHQFALFARDNAIHRECIHCGIRHGVRHSIGCDTDQPDKAWLDECRRGAVAALPSPPPAAPPATDKAATTKLIADLTVYLDSVFGLAFRPEHGRRIQELIGHLASPARPAAPPSADFLRGYREAMGDVYDAIEPHDDPTLCEAPDAPPDPRRTETPTLDESSPLWDCGKGGKVGWCHRCVKCLRHLYTSTTDRADYLQEEINSLQRQLADLALVKVQAALEDPAAPSPAPPEGPRLK